MDGARLVARGPPLGRALRAGGAQRCASSRSGFVCWPFIQDFVVEVRAGRPAGRPNESDDVAAPYLLAVHHREAREVAVLGDDAEAVIEDDQVAVVAADARPTTTIPSAGASTGSPCGEEMSSPG